ncbi:biotin-dependent carboxyltransferase family protein [Aestuariibacter halophilus]|uniref:Biotin-dependent carboxyltransferase family protein n=1 Tax=Fluctibacter halophilus TaxID=226011 RepID=A0ABS8G5I4_9ALTE|nr:biotin-dependent carboxyltransferase family protein [Aestuariibacter halophilus]MCC2615366.1 biotin-dependent carboxyltransferase family protein [Aestuariibacter halophilus]
MTDKAVLRITQASMQTLLTDRGRQGAGRQGLSQGGAVDGYSFDWASHLVGQAADSAGLEILIGPLALDVLQDCQVAITGAPGDILLDGVAQPSWQTLSLKAGQHLVIGQCDAGLRRYLAVGGGFQGCIQFGCVTTVPREHLGGLCGDGAALQQGDVLTLARQPTFIPHLSVPEAARPDFPDQLCVQVVMGYQYDLFSSSAVRQFGLSQYTVSQRADRMGVRLTGPAIESPVTQMASEGIGLGAVQIPADGQPIVMLNDRQSIGGYPKIGSVYPRDCQRLAQLAPGARLRFSTCSVFDADNRFHLERAQWQHWLAQMISTAGEK